MARRKGLTAVFVGCLVSSPVITTGQDLGALLAGSAGSLVTGELAKRVGTELIQEARAAGANLIGQGQHAGDALMIKMGNEVTILADGIARLAGAEASKKVGEMGALLQPKMALLQQLIEESPKYESRAYQLKDAIILDVRANLATIKGIGDPFYVQRIEGISQIVSDNDYTVSIWGTGLGIPSSKLRSTITLFIAGKPVSTSPQRPNAHIATFTVPNEILEPHFQGRALGTVDAEFKIRHEVKGWFFWTATDHCVPIKLALIPKFAGSITVNATSPKYAWQSIGTRQEVKLTSDHNCPRCENPPKTPYTVTIKGTNSLKTQPIPGDQRLRNARGRCVTDVRSFSFLGVKGTADVSACPWTSLAAVTLSENDSRATAQFLVWGSPVTLEVSADAEEWSLTPDTTTAATPYDLFFDDIVEIKVPTGSGVVSVASGLTFSKERLTFVVGQNTQNLSLQKEVQGPSETSYLYKVLRPTI
jgi:hypothetical protein